MLFYTGYNMYNRKLVMYRAPHSSLSAKDIRLNQAFNKSKNKF